MTKYESIYRRVKSRMECQMTLFTYSIYLSLFANAGLPQEYDQRHFSGCFLKGWWLICLLWYLQNLNSLKMFDVNFIRLISYSAPHLPDVLKTMTWALAGMAQLVGALSCKPKCCWFDSWSGHVPGLWVWSSLEHVGEGTESTFLSPSLFPSLPLCLKTNGMSSGGG